MNFRCQQRRVFSFGWAALMVPVLASADTICTHIPQNAEAAPAEAPRESQRVVKTRVVRDFIARGDAAAEETGPRAAAYFYAKVFRPFGYKGMNYTAERCASQSLYRQAAEKLNDITRQLAVEDLAQGHYLPGESSNEIEGQPGGALSLFLLGNHYDAFIEHSLEYAARELRERDIRGELVGLAERRLRELESARDHAAVYQRIGLKDDTEPLLDAELAAFDKLSGFAQRLEAHLAPLYPAITDYWLDEEARRYRDLMSQESTLQQSVFVDHAAGALSEGIARLRHHPVEIGRLKERGNTRGDELMSESRHGLARAYFDAVGNAAEFARADSLARRKEEKEVAALKRTVEAEIEGMQKSDAEKAVFDKETEDMAAEFGFDLEGDDAED